MPRLARSALAAAALAALAAPSAARAERTVELIPLERMGWTFTNFFAPLTGLFLGGPGYWYEPRRIEVVTTPPGALLDLFYVRRSYQRGFEQAEAPVTVVLPSRIEAGPSDSLVVRAALDGYESAETSVAVRSRETRLELVLRPVANQLVGFSYASLAGRASLAFLTRRPLVLRVQQGPGGPSLILPETSASPEQRAALEGVRGPLFAALRPQPLGEDLVVRVALGDAARDGGYALRSREGEDPVRGVHVFALDLVPPDGGAAGVERARATLARIGPADASGCALAFDAALRERLDPESLARALSPRGDFVDPFLRAALRRLGEVSPRGEIELLDGTRYRASVPLELSAAASEPAQAKGYLALLRRLADGLEAPEHRREALRGLVAPELPAPAFDAALDAALDAERRCRS